MKVQPLGKFLVAAAVVVGGLTAVAPSAGALPAGVLPLQLGALPSNAQLYVPKDAGANLVSCATPGTCSAIEGYQRGNGSQDIEFASVNESAGTWGSATALTFPAEAATNNAAPEINGLSCWSAGNCVAVGAINVGVFQTTSPWVLTETAGVWGSGTVVPIAAGTSAEFLNGVDCVSATTCVAVGYALSTPPFRSLPLVLSKNAGSWGSAAVLTLPADAADGNAHGQLSGVSCLSTVRCEAVGSYGTASGTGVPLTVDLTSGAAGTPTEGAVPAGWTSAGLAAVSCSSSAGCQAVGSASGPGGNLSALVDAYSAGAWQVPTVLSIGSTSTWLTTVSCATDGSCLAGGIATASGPSVGVLAVTTGGGWTGAVVAPPSGLSGDQINGVSCPTPGSCAAAETASGVGIAGSTPDVATVTAGTVATRTVLPVPSDIGVSGSGSLNAVNCPSAGHCVALGVYRAASLSYNLYAQTLVGGAAGPPTQVATSVSAAPDAVQISCTDQTNCVGVIAGDSATTVVTEVAGAWSSSKPFSAGIEIEGLDCLSSTSCVGVGTDEVHHVAVTTTFDGTNWSSPGGVAVVGVPSSYASTLTQVSCWAPGSCEAVGTVGPDHYTLDQVGLAVAETGGTWGKASIPGFWPHSNFFATTPSGLSCVASGDCVVVGTFYGSPASSDLLSGTWQTPQVPSFPVGTTSASITSVSCVDASNCVAVGTDQGSSNTDQVFWATAAITGTSTSRFVASPVLSPYSGSVDPSFVAADAAGVSCGSAAACAVVGSTRTALPNINVWPAFTVTGAPPPAAPTGLKSTPVDGGIRLSWTAPASNGGPAPTSYVASAGGHTCTTSTLSCTITGLTNGTSYQATVVAINATGQGPVSSSIWALAAGAPGAPTVTKTVLGTNGSVDVTLAPPASNGGSPITSYHYIYLVGGTIVDEGSASASTTTYFNLPSGATVSIEAAATNAVGTGPYSAPAVVHVPWRPTAPSHVVAIGAATSISVSWAAASSNGKPISGYRASAYSGSTLAAPDGTCTTTTATSCVITKLPPKSFFTVVVTAINGDGSTASDPVYSATSTKPPGAPGAVTALTGTPTKTSVALKWKAPKKAGFTPDLYLVSQTVGGKTTQLGQSSSTTFKVVGLSSGTAYTFTVQVLANNGQASPPTSVVVKTKF